MTSATEPTLDELWNVLGTVLQSESVLLISGLVLTGLATITLGLFHTSFGRGWLDRTAQRIREIAPDSDQARHNQLVIKGLYPLDRSHRAEELKKGEPGFEAVVDYITESRTNSLPNGESIYPEDNVVKFERVDAGYKGVDPKERGVGSLSTNIHAVMEDNSRKIAGIPDDIHATIRGVKREERKRKNRIESRIKDGFRLIVIILFIIGVGTHGYVYWFLI